MRLFIGLIALTILVLPAGEARAECPSYQVRSGDTLRLIAERFYGRRDASGRIHAANRSKIGPNPNLIEPGQRLYIPCSDPENPPSGTGSAAKPAVVAAQPEDSPQEELPSIEEQMVQQEKVAPSASSSSGVLPRINTSVSQNGDAPMKASQNDAPMMAKDHEDAMPQDDAEKPDMENMAENSDEYMEEKDGQEAAMMKKPEMQEKEMAVENSAMHVGAMPSLSLPEGPQKIHVLTGGPFSPFVGENLSGGGMITELVENALGRRPGPEVEIVFVNDRASHLDGVMPRGGFALTFPWAFPNCNLGEVRSEDQQMCETYRSSDGFYEFVTEFYARADLPWAGILIPSALAGARICRPMGYPVDDLYELGLMPDKVELIRGRDSIDCLLMVDRADADIASMDAAVTRSLIDRITVKNPILVLEPLTRVDKLRVLAPKSDPRSAETILRLNAGLREMSEDGSWFEIVNRHLKGGNS